MDVGIVVLSTSRNVIRVCWMQTSEAIGEIGRAVVLEATALAAEENVWEAANWL